MIDVFTANQYMIDDVFSRGRDTELRTEYAELERAFITLEDHGSMEAKDVYDCYAIPALDKLLRKKGYRSAIDDVLFRIGQLDGINED